MRLLSLVPCKSAPGSAAAGPEARGSGARAPSFLLGFPAGDGAIRRLCYHYIMPLLFFKYQCRFTIVLLSNFWA